MFDMRSSPQGFLNACLLSCVRATGKPQRVLVRLCSPRHNRKVIRMQSTTTSVQRMAWSSGCTQGHINKVADEVFDREAPKEARSQAEFVGRSIGTYARKTWNYDLVSTSDGTFACQHPTRSTFDMTSVINELVSTSDGTFACQHPTRSTFDMTSVITSHVKREVHVDFEHAVSHFLFVTSMQNMS